jgi:chemotaxis protein CheD
MNLQSIRSSVIPMPRRVHILNPGEWTVCHAPAIVETLLGSCVSIALWCGERRVGGLCHYVLPVSPASSMDGRYGDAAMSLMLRRLANEGIYATDCVAKIYGGGKMFQFDSATGDIGSKNIEAGLRMLEDIGIRVVESDIGGWVYRKISFDLATGGVVLTRGDADIIAGCP